MLNVVDNLNCVKVINKPCVREARCMRLIPWTLHSGSEQFIYNWKLEKKSLDLDQGNWRQHNGTDKRNPEQRYIEKGI
jgi:hypothetical protein